MSERERLHSALANWTAAQNITGQVSTFSVAFPAEFDDDPPLDPVRMYERPALALEKLLDADAAAGAGRAPGTDDAFADLHYAAARLGYLLDPKQKPDQPFVWRSGWPQSQDAAEAFGELARLAERVSALIEQADGIIGRELRDGRLTPAAAQAGGRAAAPAELNKRLHDSVATAQARLGKAAAQLRRMQLRARELRRTMQAAVAGPGDGPTLHRQYLVRCKPLDYPAAYQVRIFRPSLQRPLVIIGGLRDNHSTSITNGAKAIASAISQHILRTRHENAVVWVQYEPAEKYYEPASTGLLHDEDDAKILSFTPGFAGLDGHRRIDHEKLEQLAGGPVRRWHVYDYTIDAVTDAGAEPVELTIPDRKRS
jgi:hypothetical protein